MYLFNANRRSAVLPGVGIVILIILCLQIQTADAARKGTWVVYDGKDQFELGKAKQIPLSALASIRGYDKSAGLPRVYFIDPDGPDTTELEVTRKLGTEPWVADLPSLEPNSRAVLQVDQFVTITEEDNKKVHELFIKFLLKAWEVRVSLDAKDINDTYEIQSKSEDALRKVFGDDTSYRKYVVLSPDGKHVSLLDLIIYELIGDPSLELDNTISIIRQSLKNIKRNIDMARGQDSIWNSITPDDRIAAEKFVYKIPYEILSNNDDTSFQAFSKFLLDSQGHFPISDSLSNSLCSALSNPGLVLETDGSLLKIDLDNLAERYNEKLRKIMKKLHLVQSRSYTFNTSQAPLIFADLARYGAFDFVGSFIPSRDETRGFLTLSFFPTGPKSRTPLASDPQWAPVLGYSVAGGEEDDPEFLLLGITIRFNRTVNVTAGLITNPEDTKVWYGTFGVAGDLTNIPFLGNLFTTK